MTGVNIELRGVGGLLCLDTSSLLATTPGFGSWGEIVAHPILVIKPNEMSLLSIFFSVFRRLG